MTKFRTKPTGRPSGFSDEIAGKICEKLASGMSLREICSADDFPDRSTVMRWLADASRQPFRDQYARAREAQADVLFDEILTIADTPVIGVKTTTKGSSVEKTEGDMIEHRRLQIDARKWIAGKLAPKKYGEKFAHELTGKDGGPVEVADARERLAGRIAGVAARIGASEAPGGADGG